MSHRANVLEYSSPTITDGVVKGVKIIGIESRNGYRYSVEALQKAIPLYENVAVFIQHPNGREQKRGSRQLTDHFGSLKAVRERQNGKGIYGDLHIKLSHPMAKGVLESLDKAKFGLSHNAVVRMNEDESEVLEILEINSVDLVDDPATTTTLFEEEEMTKEFQAELIERLDKIDARFDKIEAKAVTEAAKPPEKKQRITAFEKVGKGNGEGEALPVYGVSHEDFLAGLTGIRKGVTQ